MCRHHRMTNCSKGGCRSYSVPAPPLSRLESASALPAHQVGQRHDAQHPGCHNIEQQMNFQRLEIIEHHHDATENRLPTMQHHEQHPGHQQAGCSPQAAGPLHIVPRQLPHHTVGEPVVLHFHFFHRLKEAFQHLIICHIHSFLSKQPVSLCRVSGEISPFPSAFLSFPLSR